jgi:hypothetical protein
MFAVCADQVELDVAQQLDVLHVKVPQVHEGILQPPDRSTRLPATEEEPEPSAVSAEAVARPWAAGPVKP